MNISSPTRGVRSSYDCIDDHDEKEVSDDDDDDRNHKHRRRETHSQSLEFDSVDQGLSRPFRRRNNFYENGGSFRENEPRVSESWKGFNAASFEKNVHGKFDKRRLNTTSVPQTSDFNHKYRPNLIPPGEFGFGRGRGRNPGAWNQRDSRVSSVDIASQLVQRRPIPPSLFAGRGLPNLSNQQSSSWSTFGLMPGTPNGGLDMIHSFGLQGTLRQPINSALNIVVPRQRCRDFEERGFCLRGDMCPMEHGVNRIVVEDVQSLSQFNLPVSVPSTHMLGKSSVLGSLPATGTSSTLTTSKEFHINSSKPGLTVADDNLNLNGTYSGRVADFYDPDQPSWNNRPELASSLEAPDIDEAETLLNEDLIDRHLIRSSNNPGSEYSGRSNVTTVVSQSSNFTAWGRMGSSKNRLDVIEKTDSMVSSCYEDHEMKEDPEVLGKRNRGGDASNEMSLKTDNDIIRNTRKPSQKSLCTLFVNGIPQKSNKRETLLSHFQKFGEVIDIHIPTNSELAFVQFSKREEAEAALTAPDAVLGNRFIKLWWAKRDNIPDDGLSRRFSAPCGATHPVLSSANRVGENRQSASKGRIIDSSDVSVSDSDHPKPLNGPKVPPKKLQSLEQMKEELRKKQEMLDQKRNDFRRKLDKLEKQATGIKGEAAKRPKVEVAADASKVDTPKLSDPNSVMAPPDATIVGDENVESHKVEVAADASKVDTPKLSDPNSVMAPTDATIVGDENAESHTPETSGSSLIHGAISLQPPVDREKSPSTTKASAEPHFFEEVQGDGKSDHSTSNGVENPGEADVNSQQEIC